MKNLNTYNEFIDFLNESVNVQSLIKKNVKAMNKIIAKYGFTDKENVGDDYIYMDISDKVDRNDAVGSKELQKLKDELVKYAKKDGIAILVNLDINSQIKKLQVMFPSKEIKPRNVYHVTSSKNVESILKNGLNTRTIQDHSNSFSGNKTATYKAIFGVYQTGGIKEVTNFFKFDDPVVLKIKPKPYTWYDDPLMPMYVPSVLTYDDIKPEDIAIK